jgi:2-keto-3-deoxy-L-rhamnonate aldolase RhmA
MTRATLTLALALCLGAAAPLRAQQTRIYNTVKEKLARGEQVVGGTVDTADPDIYCAVANAGFDFTWIEMQHSPLTYSEVADMIWACRDATAIPFIRVPSATEGDIQKAVDIGALGVIIPMVDDLQEIRNAVSFAKYPPQGRRSQGGGQYGALWGRDYRATANDNVMIVAMIENPTGVAMATEIANTPGVDVVFAASSDLGSFSGYRQGDAQYEALVTTIKNATLAAGHSLGGPLAWMSTREGYSFFQGPGATALVRSGARVTLEEVDPCRFLPSGTAPVPGEDPCP